MHQATYECVIGAGRMCRENSVYTCEEKVEVPDTFWRKAYSCDEATCVDGECLLLDHPCQPEQLSVCADGAAARCRQGFATPAGRCDGALPGTQCLDVVDERGARALCVIDRAPCEASHCEGSVAVVCTADGYAVARTLCDGDTPECSGGGCSAPECADASLLNCDGDRLFSCFSGLPTPLRDCAATGDQCVEVGADALCSGQTVPPSPEWVAIEGGEFTFRQQTDDGWVERQEIVADFEMLKTEVTHSQYLECVNGFASSDLCSFETTQCPDVPPQVWMLPSEWQADAPERCFATDPRGYCAAVGGRLPTDIEWQFARSSRGTTGMFPWGDEPADCERAILADNPDTTGCGRNEPWPSCSRDADITEQGLCDLVGNVMELVEDSEAIGSSRLLLMGASFATPIADVQTIESAPPRIFWDITGPPRYATGFRCAR